MDQATELRRAYATLGIGESATLEEARAAYSTWSMLLSDLAVVGDSSGAEAGAQGTEGVGRSPEPAHAPGMFARHELDLAWYAIEQAHIDGALFVRRARGCSECGRTPAVRITLHTVQSGCFRARRTTTSSLVCRDCGLAAVADAQRQNRRHGWWNTLGPVWTVQALTRNAGEGRFLRRVDAPPRRPAPGPRMSEEDLYAPRPRRRSVRILGWITGLAAIGLTVGMAVPVATGDHEPPPPASSTADPAAK